jgi:hypothetical protein
VSAVLAVLVVQTSLVQSGTVKVKSLSRRSVCLSTTDSLKQQQLTASSVSKYGSTRKKKSQEQVMGTTVEAVEAVVAVLVTSAVVVVQNANHNAKARIN